MTLARIGGFESVTVPVNSSAVYQQLDLEVGMALDITGSMKDEIDRVMKIDALKSAFKDFTEALFPKQQSDARRVRVALAPYSASIKLGSYASDATGSRSADGCVTERMDTTATDAVSNFYVRADGEKDVDRINGSDPYDCPESKPAITPLLDSKKALDDIVDTYNASGSTGGHFGVQWAWNLISEDWAGTFTGDGRPAAYDEVTKGKLMKAVVLMTDGEFNTAFHGRKSSEQAIELCEAMRKRDVIVFAVAFGNLPEAEATLKACATPGQGYFAVAGNEEELSAVFKQFAGKLSQLRISK